MKDPDFKLLVAFGITVVLMTIALAGMFALVMSYLGK
ncbi:hypothetical protein PPL19_05300 [Pseudomonas psychrotolerans L19]|nr:hypothetical protein PPL19_05300 [Pseudomonas psychrotolerans L19]TCQ94090.1 hypothetical protein EC839_101211 [Pseudomonas sp. JUb52]